MFVILSVATDTRAVGEAAAIAIGGTVGLDAMFGGPISGASMNPARSLGPALDRRAAPRALALSRRTARRRGPRRARLPVRARERYSRHDERALRLRREQRPKRHGGADLSFARRRPARGALGRQRAGHRAAPAGRRGTPGDRNRRDRSRPAEARRRRARLGGHRRLHLQRGSLPRHARRQAAQLAPARPEGLPLEDVRPIRDEIERRVDELVDELDRPQPPPEEDAR